MLPSAGRFGSLLVFTLVVLVTCFLVTLVVSAIRTSMAPTFAIAVKGTRVELVTGVAPVRPGPIYWGVLIDGVPFDMGKLEAFEKQVNKKVSIVHWGQPWVIKGVYQPFQTAQFDAVRAHGAIPMIDWGSWDLGSGVDQPDFSLRQIYQGRYDGYIREWAKTAAAWNHPLFLRFDHEMNGTWYPWSEQANGNQPGDYVKAWQHVHQIFREESATNVTWVWCPNITDDPESTPAGSLYPGNQYVDWIGMDGYDHPVSAQNDPGQPFYSVFKHTYDELTSLAPDKPLMIAEVGSSEQRGARVAPGWKAAWIRDAFVTELPIRFPKVQAVVWFNWNDNKPELDWPIASSQASIAAFAQAIASPYYASNVFGHLDVSPIRAPN